MDLKEKELLLKDLSSRLFYNPWVQFNLEYGDNGHKEGLYKAHISSIDPTSGWLEVNYFETETLEKEWSSTIENVKPYLRPMSSMTEKEKKELKKLFDAEEVTNDSLGFTEGGTLEDYISQVSYDFCGSVTDWLLAHHFDYRFPGLIEKGLAIEAPTGMY